MKDFCGQNDSETRLIKAIQRALKIYDNGWVGMQTMTALAQTVGAECWPLTVELYGQPCIIARDITASCPKAGVGEFKNCLSGSFSDGVEPVSVLVSEGKVIRGHSCHFWEGSPESVLYCTEDGDIGIKRVKTIHELPASLHWAVGGFGLLGQYDPEAEGFVGKFSDVLRRTNHTVLGEKDGWLYLLYCKNMTAQSVNTFCKTKLKLDKAVMLDGGHIAAINGEESFAKINTKQKQLYIIQAV